MARKYLGIPATSIAALKDEDGDKKSYLPSENVEKLIWLHENRSFVKLID